MVDDLEKLMDFFFSKYLWVPIMIIVGVAIILLFGMLMWRVVT